MTILSLMGWFVHLPPTGRFPSRCLECRQEQSCASFLVIWFSTSSPPYCFISQLSMLNRLPTFDRIGDRFAAVDSPSFLCKMCPE